MSAADVLMASRTSRPPLCPPAGTKTRGFPRRPRAGYRACSLRGKKVGRARHAAEKKVPVARRLCPVAEREHQIRPVHASGVPMPVEPIQPDERHPVRRRQPARVDEAAEPFVILALHDGMHGADVDVLRIPVRDPLLDLPNGLLQIDGTYADTQYVDARESHERR